MKKDLFLKHFKNENSTITDSSLEEIFKIVGEIKPSNNKKLVSQVKYCLYSIGKVSIKTRTIYELLSKISGFQNYNVALSRNIDFRTIFFKPYDGKIYTTKEIELNPSLLENKDILYIEEWKFLDLSFSNIKVKIKSLPKKIICRKGISLFGQDEIKNINDVELDSGFISLEDMNLSQIPEIKDCRYLCLVGNMIKSGTVSKDTLVGISNYESYQCLLNNNHSKIDLFVENSELHKFTSIDVNYLEIRKIDASVINIPIVKRGFISFKNKFNQVIFNQDSLPDGIECYGDFQDFTFLPRKINKNLTISGDFKSLDGFPRVAGDLFLCKHYDKLKDEKIFKKLVSGKIHKYWT